MYKDVAKNIELFDVKIPKTIVPQPIDTDYNLGFIRRYFIRKSNDEAAHIFEVDEFEYQNYLKNPFWKCVSLKWRIAGPIDTIYKDNGEVDDKGVRNSNKSAISLISSDMKNIGLYLPNILQFHK